MEPLQGFATLGARELARLTFHRERTARRWIRAGLAPRHIVQFLRLIYYRPLGELCAAWDGWSLREGKLQAPNGYTYTPQEVMTITLRRQQIGALEQQLAALSKAAILASWRQSLLTFTHDSPHYSAFTNFPQFQLVTIHVATQGAQFHFDRRHSGDRRHHARECRRQEDRQQLLDAHLSTPDR